MEDRDIVELFWNRDPAAIRAVSEKYGKLCGTLARNILRSREDAEECVNDAFLNAWNAIPPARPAELAAFLSKIVRSLSFNRYRKNRAEKRGGGELPGVLEELGECVPGPENVERETDRRELLRAVQEFLDGLPADKRRLFVCRYWYADSVAGLAKRSGMTANAAAASLSRLRRKLRKHLEERGLG